MPSTGVVDAFKNLIRHGKNHQTARQHDELHAQQAQAAQQNRQQRNVQEKQQQHQPQPPAVQQQPAQKQQHTQKQQPTEKYKDHVETIVQEEREAKGKMPIYKGLEDFKLIDKMGDGAFSNVYKAIDLRNGEKVAVKVVRKFELNASQAGDKHLNREFKKRPRVTERANILKEVQIMRGINHPGIVKLISFSESPEHYFLVLELMEGGELFHQIVKLTYFSENLARHVILQVAEGIRYLHEERGVVHRDIKPENLLFDRVPIIPTPNPPPRQFEEEKEDEGVFIPGVGGGGIGRVKLADFGLSKVVWDEQTMTPCGTVGYTAPEIVKDERYSKSVDMWALGCVLYTLLCGFPPFYDESINVLTEKVARGHYTFLSPWWDAISASAKDLITHLLCVDPAQRYSIDEFLAHPWCNEAPAPMPAVTPAPATPGLHEPRPLDSPFLQDPRMVRSPGINALKEAFDITYAVHRMEEEGARRRAAKGGANRGFLDGLNESDEDEEEDEDDSDPEAEARESQRRSRAQAQAQAQVQAKAKAQAQQGQGQKLAARRAVHDASGQYDGRAGPRDRGRKKGTAGFELDMDNATLLGRRHKRGGNLSGATVPAEGNPFASPLRELVDPGSPMRVD